MRSSVYVCLCVHTLVRNSQRDQRQACHFRVQIWQERDINERADHSITSLSTWMVIIRGHNLIAPWTQDMHGAVWIVKNRA